MADSHTLYVVLTANAAGYRSTMRGAARDTREFADEVERINKLLATQNRRLQDGNQHLADRHQAQRTSNQSTRHGTNLQDAYNQRLLDTINHLNALNQLGQNQNNNSNPPLNTWRRQANAAGNDIDRFSGRLGILLDGILTLAPALIPIGAQLGTVTAGFALMGAAGVLAAGSVVTAFNGVADAVKAVREYQLDPSLANFEKAQEEMGNLGAKARRFVLEFQRFRPVLRDIRNGAARGLLPGLTRALDEFEDAAPRVERLFNRVAKASGDAVADGVESLTGPRWWDFWDYLETEAPSVVTRMATLTGNLGHGLGQMLIAADPGAQDFIGWLGDVAEGFDKWASSAQGTEDIEGFLDYARRTGPDVAEFFGEAGGAMVDLIQASAPLGGVVLDSLTAILRVVGDIADSDLAGPIMSGLIALRLYNRALQVTQAGQSRLQSMNTFTYGPPPGQQGPSNGVPLFGRLTAQQRSSMNAAQLRERQMAQRQAVARGVGVGVGGALLASGVAGDQGISNTAMFGVLGAAVSSSPYVIGLAVAAGAAMDAAAANDAFVESAERADAAMGRGDFAGANDAYQQAADEASKFKDRVDIGFLEHASVGDALASWKNDIEGLFGQSDVEENEEKLAKLRETMMASEQTTADLGKAMGMTVGPLDQSARSYAELNAVIEAATPAMDKLLLTQDELIARQQLQDAARNGDSLVNQAGLAGIAGLSDKMLADPSKWANIADMTTKQIVNTMRQMDSDAGRLDAVSGAIGSIGTAAKDAATAADDLRTSLAAALNPDLDAEAAVAAIEEILDAMGELDASDGFDLKTEGGRENAAQTRDYATAVQERLATMVETANTSKELATIDRRLAAESARLRQAFIDEGVANGFSREQMVKRANAIGLTPKLVRTVFEASGLTGFERDVIRLRLAMAGLPKKAISRLQTEGVPQSIEEARKMARELELTAKERKALIRLVDLASGKARAVAAALDNAARDRNATITITTRHVNVTENRRAPMIAEGSIGSNTNDPSANGSLRVGGRRRFADGGWGVNGRYYERVPQLIEGGPTITWGEQETGWEAYISGKPSQRARNLRILDMAAQRLGVSVAAPGRAVAADGRIGSQRAHQGGGTTVVVQRAALPDKMTLRIGEHEVTAIVRDEAGRVVDERLEGRDASDDTADRMIWS